eukprot:COSAG02_NODE_5_length_66751_cov_63.939148_61_plen_189_part_00
MGFSNNLACGTRLTALLLGLMGAASAMDDDGGSSVLAAPAAASGGDEWLSESARRMQLGDNPDVDICDATASPITLPSGTIHDDEPDSGVDCVDDDLTPSEIASCGDGSDQTFGLVLPLHFAFLPPPAPLRDRRSSLRPCLLWQVWKQPRLRRCITRWEESGHYAGVRPNQSRGRAANYGRDSCAWGM